MVKQKALFVDDMNEVWDEVSPYLNKLYNLDYANNAKRALELIRDNNYGLVVSDYDLGENSPRGGLKVIRTAREKGLRAILISTENHELKASELGAKFMFKKEFFESIKNAE